VLLIRRSFQTSRVEIVGRHALHCVNRPENGAPNNDKPFYGKQKIKTIRKHANVFTQTSRYIWRTADMPERPEYRLTEAQKQALARLQHAASGRVLFVHNGQSRVLSSKFRTSDASVQSSLYSHTSSHSRGFLAQSWALVSLARVWGGRVMLIGHRKDGACQSRSFASFVSLDDANLLVLVALRSEDR
jgi:hypothetical protein